MSRLTLSFKGKILKVVPVTATELVIGSEPDCEIHIDSLAVHTHHASVTRTDSGIVIRDLDTPEGTFVNNQRITDHTLKDGDLIRVGKHTLNYTEEPLSELDARKPDPVVDAAPEPVPVQRPRTAWLQILSGANLGKTISLSRQMTNLGKPGIQTAIIARRNGGFFLSHLEGKHPPRVGDNAIGDTAFELHDGDIIQIGNVKMQFYLQ